MVELDEPKCDGCGKRPEVYGSSWCAQCERTLPEHIKRRILSLRNALMEITRTNRYGQLMSIKADVSDVVGPLIGFRRAVRRESRTSDDA